MFTYGYIREATMAHLDIDEDEAQAMNLLTRFHIYANEAMQAICPSKPKNQYLDITVVKEYKALVINSEGLIQIATEEEIADDTIPKLNEVQTKSYWNDLNVYKINEKVAMKDDFIAWADKQTYKIVKKKFIINTIDDFGCKEEEVKEETEKGDFSYISKNEIIFHREGRYLIPGRYLWFRFDSGIGDEQELNMPADIVLCIPLYIASICLQVDSIQRANIKRNEFELALSRCTSTDFMPVRRIKDLW